MSACYSPIGQAIAERIRSADRRRSAERRDQIQPSREALESPDSQLFEELGVLSQRVDFLERLLESTPEAEREARRS